MRRARKAANLSGSALSAAAGLDRGTATALENGGRIPRVDTVEHLARALGRSPCALAFGVEVDCPADDILHSASLPQRLHETRDAMALSLREVARRSKASANMVHMTETGQSVPTLATVETLAAALRVSPCWLAYGIGPRDLLPRGRSSRTAQTTAQA
ncbi:MAG: helix-turn-helix domain-containing protein [Myxococcales bacterium]|nr:helix-turn-helix domain-containing protein [Myxococcales bacterium]